MSDQITPEIASKKNTFKKVGFDNAVKIGLAAIFLKYPALRVWPLKPMIEGVATFFANKLFDSLSLVFDLGAIPIINSMATREFERDDIVLKIIARDKGIDSKEFQEATINAQESFSKFMHTNA